MFQHLAVCFYRLPGHHFCVESSIRLRLSPICFSSGSTASLTMAWQTAVPGGTRAVFPSITASGTPPTAVDAIGSPLPWLQARLGAIPRNQGRAISSLKKPGTSSESNHFDVGSASIGDPRFQNSSIGPVPPITNLASGMKPPQFTHQASLPGLSDGEAGQGCQQSPSPFTLLPNLQAAG